MRHTWVVILLIAYAAAGHTIGSFRKHKSADELSRMSGSALVREYCAETGWSAFPHEQYHDELRRHILRRTNVDAALHTIAQVLDEYEPRDRSKRSAKRLAHATAAISLLQLIDDGAVRVRGIPAGRLAIASFETYLRRKVQAGENDRSRAEARAMIFEAEVLGLGPLKALGGRDRLIQRSLKEQRGIVLSDSELLEFVAFLIAKDPYYPSWSKIHWERDPKTGQFVGAAKLREIEPYVQALQEFRASRE